MYMGYRKIRLSSNKNPKCQRALNLKATDARIDFFLTFNSKTDDEWMDEKAENNEDLWVKSVNERITKSPDYKIFLPKHCQHCQALSPIN